MTYLVRQVSASMALLMSASQRPAAPSLPCTWVAVQAKASLAPPGQHREGCCSLLWPPIKTSMVLHTSVIPEGDPRDGLMIPLCTGIHTLLFFAGGVYLHSSVTCLSKASFPYTPVTFILKAGEGPSGWVLRTCL